MIPVIFETYIEDECNMEAWLEQEALTGVPRLFYAVLGFTGITDGFMYSYMHTCIHTHTHRFYTRARTHTHTHTHTNLCVCVCECVCVCVSFSLSLSLSLVVGARTHTYKHTHTDRKCGRTNEYVEALPTAVLLLIGCHARGRERGGSCTFSPSP